MTRKRWVTVWLNSPLDQPLRCEEVVYPTSFLVTNYAPRQMLQLSQAQLDSLLASVTWTYLGTGSTRVLKTVRLLYAADRLHLATTDQSKITKDDMAQVCEKLNLLQQASRPARTSPRGHADAPAFAEEDEGEMWQELPPASAWLSAGTAAGARSSVRKEAAPVPLPNPFPPASPPDSVGGVGKHRQQEGDARPPPARPAKQWVTIWLKSPLDQPLRCEGTVYPTSFLVTNYPPRQVLQLSQAQLDQLLLSVTWTHLTSARILKTVRLLYAADTLYLATTLQSRITKQDMSQVCTKLDNLHKASRPARTSPRGHADADAPVPAFREQEDEGEVWQELPPASAWLDAGTAAGAHGGGRKEAAPVPPPNSVPASPPPESVDVVLKQRQQEEAGPPTALPPALPWALLGRCVDELLHALPDLDLYPPGVQISADEEARQMGQVLCNAAAHHMLDECLQRAGEAAEPSGASSAAAPIPSSLLAQYRTEPSSIETELADSLARRPYSCYLHLAGAAPIDGLMAALQASPLFVVSVGNGWARAVGFNMATLARAAAKLAVSMGPGGGAKVGAEAHSPGTPSRSAEAPPTMALANGSPEASAAVNGPRTRPAGQQGTAAVVAVNGVVNGGGMEEDEQRWCAEVQALALGSGTGTDGQQQPAGTTPTHPPPAPAPPGPVIWLPNGSAGPRGAGHVIDSNGSSGSAGQALQNGVTPNPPVQPSSPPDFTAPPHAQGGPPMPLPHGGLPPPLHPSLQVPAHGFPAPHGFNLGCPPVPLGYSPFHPPNLYPTPHVFLPTPQPAAQPPGVSAPLRFPFPLPQPSGFPPSTQPAPYHPTPLGFPAFGHSTPHDALAQQQQQQLQAAMTAGDMQAAPQKAVPAESPACGLPKQLRHQEQVQAMRSALEQAVEAVWPLGPNTALPVLLCHHASKAAIDAGVLHHTRQLVMREDQGQEQGSAIALDLSAFSVPLAQASAAATATWLQGHAGRSGEAAVRLLEGKPQAMRAVLLTGQQGLAGQQQQPVTPQELLLQMVEVPGDGSGAWVRLRAAALFNVARSKFNLAEELARSMH